MSFPGGGGFVQQAAGSAAPAGPTAAAAGGATVGTGGSGVTISFSQVLWDTDGGMVDLDAQPTRVTCPSAGKYLVLAYGVWDSGSTTGIRMLQLNRWNSAGVLQKQRIARQPQASASYAQEQTVPAQLDCSQGDYFTVLAYHERGSNLGISGVRLEVTKLL